MSKRVFSLMAFTCLALITILNSCDKSNGEVQYIPVQLSDGGAWSFINDKGERVGTQEWEFEPSVTIDGIFTARSDSGMTVYSWSGDEAKPIDSLTNLVSVGIYNEGVIPVTPHMQRIRIVDKKGKIKFILEPIDGKEVSSCAAKMSEGLLVVNTVDGKAGVVNSKGEVVFKPKYSRISDFHNGFALAADYSGDYEDGPKYFVLDKDGNEKRVTGDFGYSEGECDDFGDFEHGQVFVYGPIDTTDYSSPLLSISTEGKVSKEKPGYVTFLDNGGKVVYNYNDDKSSYTWTDPEGKTVLKVSKDGEYMTAYGKYVTINSADKITIYSQDGKQLASKVGNFYVTDPGGNFGLILQSYDSDSDEKKYILLNNEGQPINGVNFYGIGTKLAIDLNEYYEEGGCGDYYEVTSAYVDITAASTKLANMIIDGIKGKEYYYIGQSVSSILSGDNCNYYSTNSYTFTIPTPKDTYYLATGAGFTINGTAKSTHSIVSPTYQQYFEVSHYDYWGRAWGYNRQRQVGVHFNSNAKVESFDLKLRTNHPSGAVLREAVGRRLKSNGYTLVSSGKNYDEFSNNGKYVILYGSDATDGLGAFISDSNPYMSESSMEEMAANF